MNLNDPKSGSLGVPRDSQIYGLTELLAYGANYPPPMKWGAAILFAVGLLWVFSGITRFYTVWPACPGKVIFAQRMCSCRSDQSKFFITTHVMITDQRLILYVADGGRGAALAPGKGFVLKSPTLKRTPGGTAYTYLLDIYDAKLGTTLDGKGNVVLTLQQQRIDVSAIIYLSIKIPEPFIKTLADVQARSDANPLPPI